MGSRCFEKDVSKKMFAQNYLRELSSRTHLTSLLTVKVFDEKYLI
jgi:hypothetical protein